MMEAPATRRGTVCVSVHVPAQVKSDLSKVAQREARTLSSLICKLAKDFLAEQSATAA
jgi:hypothetical protein